MYICSVYCAMRDQDVFVALADDPTEEMQAQLKDVAIICSRYSYAPICTGASCPNFAAGHVALGTRPGVAA